jgi:DNA-binding MarR family transcriptional regulator
MKTKEDKINDICLQLLQITNVRSQLEEKTISFTAQIKMTPREIHTIQAVGEHKSLNVKEIGEYFKVSKSAASQMLKKLTDKGFIEKFNPPHSNKELQIKLTKLGEQAFHAHKQFHKKHMNDLLKSLNDFSIEEMATTANLLNIIGKTIEKRLREL